MSIDGSLRARLSLGRLGRSVIIPFEILGEGLDGPNPTYQVTAELPPGLAQIREVLRRLRARLAERREVREERRENRQARRGERQDRRAGRRERRQDRRPRLRPRLSR